MHFAQRRLFLLNLCKGDMFRSLSGITLQFPVCSVLHPLTLSLVKAHNGITVLNRCHIVMYTVQYQGHRRFSASAFNVHTHHVKRSWQDKWEHKQQSNWIDLITKTEQLMSISGWYLQPVILWWDCMRQISHLGMLQKIYKNNNNNWIH